MEIESTDDWIEQIDENADRIYLPEFLQNIGGNPEFEWTTSYDEAVRTFFSAYE